MRLTLVIFLLFVSSFSSLLHLLLLCLFFFISCFPSFLLPSLFFLSSSSSASFLFHLFFFIISSSSSSLLLFRLIFFVFYFCRQEQEAFERKHAGHDAMHMEMFLLLVGTLVVAQVRGWLWLLASSFLSALTASLSLCVQRLFLLSFSLSFLSSFSSLIPALPFVSRSFASLCSFSLVSLSLSLSLLVSFSHYLFASFSFFSRVSFTLFLFFFSTAFSSLFVFTCSSVCSYLFSLSFFLADCFDLLEETAFFFLPNGHPHWHVDLSHHLRRAPPGWFWFRRTRRKRETTECPRSLRQIGRYSERADEGSIRCSQSLTFRAVFAIFIG